jgi:hypothetical protein
MSYLIDANAAEMLDICPELMYKNAGCFTNSQILSHDFGPEIRH